MGYFTDSKTGIRGFSPDNSDKQLYIESESNTTFGELIERAKEHFGDIDLNDISITSEYVHTRCLGYDRYDAGDYDNFIVLTYKGD